MLIPLSLIQIVSIAIFIIAVYIVIKSIKMPLEFYENQVKRREIWLEKFRKMDEEELERDEEENEDSQ
jgi:hypothetical protein